MAFEVVYNKQSMGEKEGQITDKVDKRRRKKEKDKKEGWHK